MATGRVENLESNGEKAKVPRFRGCEEMEAKQVWVVHPRKNRGRSPRGSEEPEEREEKERNQCKHDGINNKEDHELEMGEVIHQLVQ